MSYTTLKKITRRGDVVDGKIFRNAWLFQPFVWDSLIERYNIEGDFFSRWEKLWEFAGEGEPLDGFEWNTLVFTYNHVLIAKCECRLLSESLREFHARYGNRLPHNHCTAMASWIDDYIDEIRGVGLYGTSVSNDPWFIEKNDEYCPYNINNSDKHTFETLRIINKRTSDENSSK